MTHGSKLHWAFQILSLISVRPGNTVHPQDIRRTVFTKLQVNTMSSVSSKICCEDHFCTCCNIAAGKLSILSFQVTHIKIVSRDFWPLSLFTLAHRKLRDTWGLIIMIRLPCRINIIFNPDTQIYSCLSKLQFSSVQFTRSVVSDSLRPHKSQHTRPPCPSSTSGVHPNSCSSSRWCWVTQIIQYDLLY